MVRLSPARLKIVPGVHARRIVVMAGAPAGRASTAPAGHRRVAPDTDGG